MPIEDQQAETALQLERDKLKAVVDNVSIGLVLCDAQGCNISMNPAGGPAVGVISWTASRSTLAKSI